jgi:sec-independent protein translocase protein TatC
VSSPNEQSLIEHLTELRIRLIRTAYIIAIGSILGWIYSEQLFWVIRQPIAPYLPDTGLIYTGITDKFVAYLKIAVLGGTMLTCPLWLYQVWAFIAPGLYRKEKRYGIGFLTIGTGLFLSGAVFVYYLVYPMAFKYLLNFGDINDKPMITIDNYISFFLMTTLVFGVCFELPLILVVLGLLGIIDAKFLREKRRYAVVVLAILSAVVTPPDLMSMFFLLVPLLALYEISIILVRIFETKRQVST